MKKSLSSLIILILCFCLTACGTAPASLNAGQPEQAPPKTPPLPPATATDLPEPPSASVSPEPSPAPAADDSGSIALYRAFLADNYEALLEACFGGIAGIGFIDLDLDGCREMILFDGGASASMGIQFFDAAQGKVECVSANMAPLGEAFGGEHFTSVYVNANFFEDFRLIEDSSGQRFFVVESGNGAIDFSYRELIRFGMDEDGMLTLTPLFYIYQEYEIETEEIISAKYRVNGTKATEAEYSAAKSAFESGHRDLGLEAQGVFIWSDNAYAEGREGFLAMAEAAIALSESNLPK